MNKAKTKTNQAYIMKGVKKARAEVTLVLKEALEDHSKHYSPKLNNNQFNLGKTTSLANLK